MPRTINELTPQFCEGIPKEREPGVLYISKKYLTAIHLCPCGCGREVVTPLEGDEQPGWRLIEHGELISLSPSVYCLGFPCKSHYFISANKIQWC